MSIMNGVKAVTFVHAHPDDETLSTGALIADLTARGVECTVVTATRGEQGEVVDGPLASLEGTEALASHREGELRGALSVLGVSRHVFLGTPPARTMGLEPRIYRDSGMRWVSPTQAGPVSSTDERAFSVAPLEQEVSDLSAVVRTWNPDLIVTYDANGGYGHPDHVRAHDIALISGRDLGIPVAEVRLGPGPGVQWLELEHTLETVAEALRSHRSQVIVGEGNRVIMSGGQEHQIVTRMGLALAEPSPA